MKKTFVLLTVVFLLSLTQCKDDSTPPPAPKSGEAENALQFQTLLSDPDMKLINLAGSADVTLGGTINAHEFTIFVPTGTTLRNYWKVGNRNTITVAPGGNLRWETGENGNLLVGAGTSTANIRLTSGYINLIGGTADIFDVEQYGDVTVSKQVPVPDGMSAAWLNIDDAQIWTIKEGNMTVAAASGTPSAQPPTVKPTMVINGKLAVENDATMTLQLGALVVVAGTIDLSTGGSVTVNGGYVSNNAGTFNAMSNIVGFVDSIYGRINRADLGQP